MLEQNFKETCSCSILLFFLKTADAKVPNKSSHPLVSMGAMALINEKTNQLFALSLFLNVTVLNFSFR